jgi:hypothetical protein
MVLHTNFSTLFRNRRAAGRLAAVVFAALLSVIHGSHAVAQAAAAAAPAPAPKKDVLVFTNGDQLSGTLTRIVGDSVAFHSDMAGDITVPLAQVKELHTQGNYAVLKHNVPVPESRKAQPGVIAVENSNISVTPANAPTETAPVKDVAYVIDQSTFTKELARTPSFLHGWNGTTTFGATAVQSSQYGTTFTAGVAINRQVPTVAYFPKRANTIVGFQETYGKLSQNAEPAAGIVASTVKTSIMHANVEQDEYLSPRFFYLGTVTFDHNFSQLLQLQSIYGGGFGWTAITNAKEELDLRADLHYEKQQFLDPTSNTDLVGSTFSENYRRTLPLKLQLTESLTMTPSWNDPSVYSGTGSVGLALPVWRRLAVSFNTSDSYLSNPPAGADKNSFQFVTGINYSLH